MTYGNLKFSIMSYLECYEGPFRTMISVFIQNAEQRIMNAVNLPATRATVTGTIPAGSDEISLVGLAEPYLAPISLRIDVGGEPQFLLNKELDFLREMYPTAATDTPTLYAQVDETKLLVRPVPDADYTYTLQYFGNTDSIVDRNNDDNTSWLGDNMDGVLLYGSLVEAAIFNKQSPEVYEAGYQEKLALLVTLINGKNQQDQFREGAPRVSVK